jgi:Uma2 family endonuclease
MATTAAVANLSEYEIERDKPMPSYNHSTIQANLIMALAIFRQRFRIQSELSLDLKDWPSVPDICLNPFHSLDLKNDQISVSEPPLCTIEIISPTQSIDQLRAKVEKYFAHGVQSCWLVIPSLANIYVFSSPNDYAIFRASDTLHDTVLDITLPLQEVFE